MNYNVLASILTEGNILRLNRGAEIGVFEASTSTYLLKIFPALSLICVDPFLSYEEHEQDKTQEKMSQVEQIARQKLYQFGSRVQIANDYSVKVAPSAEDESLDFVFIDALHTAEAVFEDLEAWYPKVRTGGLISGHDYSWEGVQKGLEAFLTKIKKFAFHSPSTSDIWFFEK